MALSLQYRKHLTSLQSYMGIVLLLFASEMIVTYSFYYNYNASGEACRVSYPIRWVFFLIQISA